MIKKHRQMPAFLFNKNHYLTVVVALRLNFHTFSPEPATNGRSLPYEIVEIRFDSIPSFTITFLAAFARRAPKAKLYSVEPRSSQLPAIWILTFSCFFI